MPQHKSAEKRVRQSKRRNARNRVHKAEMKKLVKTVKGLIEKSAEKEEVENAYRAAIQKLDRMAVKGYLHKNNASNKKSKLSKLVNRFSKGDAA
ncbi:ribosomal protein S20 [Chloroherpeton thalassium ATCC 35110]|uniref:Small ribosomal subunit protein bS20 n=1 Tax=Chloroherpeton thalassium (strain ATCC 35110 / GB-78) TaxID=517418 RepID=RS20_CHLT3|nr:30S ribosomal protein S20 [Chloroherpeton thalassium]B3QVB0.1 RecName: Full=Small ribosomal subunit protein bS20; AltName: Full=30S ribosomal protein S20 [Chloroherpeton thalassium ATCC 35110]ACF13064.1 ribosomal protein S20 [Chloroherpeton thalassium ATCC 35110]